MKLAPLACCAIALMAAGGDVPAQTQTRSTSVYRCGPDGRDLRDAPCPGAKAAPAQIIEFDQPSSAQQAEAKQRAGADAKRSRELERERLRHEVSAGHERAIGIDGVHKTKAAAAPAGPASAAKAPSSKKPKTSKPKPPKPAKPTPAAP